MIMGCLSKGLALILILTMAISSLTILMVKPTNAQYTQNGQHGPLSSIGMVSPINTTYTANNLTMSFHIYALYTDSLYHYELNCSIDGGESQIIPSNVSFSVAVSNEYDWQMKDWFISANLPLLAEGTHQLDVYVTFLPNNASWWWYSNYYDNSSVTFTINNGIPPAISNLSIANQTYLQRNLLLNFTTNKVLSWAGYSLDGKQNATINSNTTLSDLTVGQHNLTVYANDTLGNMGNQTVDFTIKKAQTSITLSESTIALMAVTVAILCLIIGLLLYRRHRKIAKLE
jgi:hypothetical protein